MVMGWRFLVTTPLDVPITKCDDIKVGALLFMYSLWGNKIGDSGAQAVANGLQHCTDLQKLE